VLPIRQGSKVPLTPHGVKDATRDEATIRAWWSRWPEAAVAIACGSKSGGLVVLDCDAAEFVWTLENACGPLPETFTVATGRGSHRYFVACEPIRTQRIAPHLELRAEGAYVLAPPSLHPNGARYRAINNADPAPLPDALRHLLRALPAKLAATSASSTPAADKISEGTRNSTLTSLAGSMRRRGMAATAIGAALLEENIACCTPPLPEDEVRRIAASVALYKPGSKVAREGSGESAATVLVNLVGGSAKLFHHGEDGYATVTVDDHEEVLPIRSRAFRNWLGKVFFRHSKRAASGEAFSSAVTTLEGFALYESVEMSVFVRVAEHAGRIYFDPADEKWRVIEVGPDGWRLVESRDCPVRFRRPRGMLPLPLPERGGKVGELRNFLNVTDEDFPLIVGWLLMALHPRGPYPILALHGEQGSAKTSMARVLRGLVDPNAAPVRAEPKEARDLMIAASNGWVISLDNVSALPGWLSDALCRVSTGGGFATRELYSDADEKIFDAKRPSILNGIEEIATRSDLLDRCIILYLPQIPEQLRLAESELGRRFEEARPRLLGVLLDAVCAALRNVNSVTLDRLPRMADFCLWVMAAESALQWGAGTFFKAYSENRQRANDLPLENPLAEAIRKLELPFEGTAAELLSQLALLVDERIRRSRKFPSSGRALTNALRRLAPNFRQIGVGLEFYRTTDKARRRVLKLFALTLVPESAGKSASVESVQAPDHADAADDTTQSLPDAGIEEGFL
jgi:hypothetical protein